METPLSTRRITRSMAKNNDHQRHALHDITNDSPIVGLALTTPASTATKTRPRPRRTPGSGEALLRGQVKTLLQKVDEDPAPNIHALLAVARSPAHLLAPTPANTPHLSAPHAFPLTLPCVLHQEDLIPKLQVIAAALPPPVAQEDENLGECNRALLFEDSPGKSEQSNAGPVVSSSLAFQDSGSDRSPDDDSSSAWSIQVNASSEKGDDDTFTEQDHEEEWLTEDECFDDLCEGMSKISVFDDEEQEEEEEKKVGLPAFQGKHTRFIYDSDGEMEREDVAHVPVENCSMVLRGLPVPEGKHLRFHEEEDEEE
ncbi:uncharacterized protein LOC102699625 [Oryza brachyantha]|uniref:Uncharacterized protein n=1 Tax=Oryza brachyantha TaxID=4533 RepID=J3N580_ORYBR|nr:uncharacterized protein LOC102699625 [Oryza brachyantha]